MNFLFPYMARWNAVNWTRYHQIFSKLAKLGHTVHVIQMPSMDSSRETNFKAIDVESIPNIHIHEIKINRYLWNCNFPLNKIFKKGYYCLKSQRKIEKIIKEHKIDVLFLYNIPQIGLMNIRQGSVIKIFDIADDYVAMFKQELGLMGFPLFLYIAQKTMNKMIDESDITLAVSSVLRDSVDESRRSKIMVVPNGVNFDCERRNDKEKPLNLDKHPIIGFVGSFEYFIDFDLILSAARALPQYIFLLVGTGRDFSKVKKKIEEFGLQNIILTGGVAHFDVSRYIEAMDICLNIFKKIPISHGACPIKLFEYLSHHKPVISTRLEEINNINEDFLFFSDTAEELVASIKTIVSQPELARANAERGYFVVRSKYDWDKIVERFLAVVDSIAK